MGKVLPRLAERVEQAHQQIGIDAAAGVRHADVGRAARRIHRGSHFDTPTVIGEAPGIVKQVANHLRQPDGIAVLAIAQLSIRRLREGRL